MVKRILVNNGSSTNIDTIKTLKDMGVSEDNITMKTTTLVGFSGESRDRIGIIYLLICAKGVNIQVNFNVVHELSAHNMILGTPCIHKIRAAPPTLHQMVRFPKK